MSVLTYKKIISSVSALGIAAMLLNTTACCYDRRQPDATYKPAQYSDNPTIYPKKTRTVITIAAKEIDSLNKAADIAVNYCDHLHLDTDIISRKITYQGASEAEKNITDKANLLFDKKEQQASSERDYKTTMKFVCAKPATISSSSIIK